MSTSPRNRDRYDVVVVGSGPNGLAAATVLAKRGLRVLVVEAASTPGGGTRTAALTEPGFLHDVCSSVHPLGLASPWFRELGITEAGVEWIDPPAALAHVLPDGRAVTLERSLDTMAAQLGRDGAAYRALFEPFVERFDELLPMILSPLRFPKHPLLMARFGLSAIQSLKGLVRRFDDEAAPGLLAGIAAHAMLPLEEFVTASFGLVLASAGHAVGWPITRGGSRAISDALLVRLREHGGELELDHHVTSIDELPPARAYVLDVTPRQLLTIAGDRLPRGYRAGLEYFRHGPGVFKIDWALREPVPWRDPQCLRSATVHLSGTADQIAASERAVHAGRVLPEPFVLFGQPTLFDPTRAPAGQHTAWAYCHVPHGSDLDATALIENHIERHAPGFRDVILARATLTAPQMAAHNPNYIGGDINGGVSDLRQLFFRPLAKADPYATPARDIFLCSSSTPPGGGVHGMCGYWAAQSVLRRRFESV